MTGILDRIRNTTAQELDNVSGDFTDLAPEVYRPRVEREMIRTVKGADDLKPAVQLPNMNAGLVRTDGTGKIDTRPYQDQQGLPTDRQREFIASLMTDLFEVDSKDEWFTQAVDYMDRMNNARAWTPARGGNVSRWITSLKNKIAELKAAPKPVVAPATEDLFTDVPDGRYAVQDSGPGDWIFVKVSTGRKDGQYAGRRFVKIQASDEFHPIRNASRCRAILNAIRVMTPQESMLAYGQHIGACGHCGRTLTNDESRAQGIGPKCRAKMGW